MLFDDDTYRTTTDGINWTLEATAPGQGYVVEINGVHCYIDFGIFAISYNGTDWYYLFDGTSDVNSAEGYPLGIAVASDGITNALPVDLGGIDTKLGRLLITKTNIFEI